MDHVDQVQVLLSRSHDELLAQLGDLLKVEASSSRDGGLDEPRQRALNWLQRHWSALRGAICSDEAIMGLRDDRTKITIAVADIIAQNWLQSVAALIAAALLVSIGIDQLCRGDFPTS